MNLWHRTLLSQIRCGFLVVLACLLLAGCFWLPKTIAPVPTLSLPSSKSGGSGEKLLVMLPGRGNRMDIFEQHDFLSIGAQRGFDVVAVDAHFGYYMDRSLMTRLSEDIIEPARAAGYQSIWLLGVSMGGFGALLYAEQHPQQISGVVLLGPYLGDGDIQEEIEASGGFDQWNPRASKAKDYEVAIWSWLRDNAGLPDGTPVFLGYGIEDRFAPSFAPLLEVLPASRVISSDGGHKWVTWRPLWEQIATRIDPGHL